MVLKNFFIKHISTIVVVFPLVIIIFYGILVSFTLKYKHKEYESAELHRYEVELKKQHRYFFKEKVQYIDSFINFISMNDGKLFPLSPTSKILLFIESLKKYNNGFIFIIRRDGTLLQHPCGEKLIKLITKYKKNDILEKLLNASKNHLFINYQGTNCIDDKLINKIAFVHHIKNTDLYVVITKNEKDIAESIKNKKMILEQKLNDELTDVMRLLIIVSIISIIFSIFFSKILNKLIKDYELEIKKNQKVMFSQSRLAQAGELLSMISHQWRQPIGKIASIISNIRFKIMIDNSIDLKYLDSRLAEVEDYTEFLSETIDDFRKFYKPNTKKEETYIIPLIEKALGFLEDEIRKKDITIVKLFTKDTKVSLYPNELIQVIINIVQNAIDFSPKKASIKIETILKPKEYIISIIDEAGGIDKDKIEHIFDAHFSTKKSKNSTHLGLGLYVSKVIIEKHFYGKLEVENIDNGSKFTIRLAR